SPSHILTINEADHEKMTSPFSTMYLSSISEVHQSQSSEIPFRSSLIFRTGNLSSSFFGGYFWQAKPFKKMPIELNDLSSQSEFGFSTNHSRNSVSAICSRVLFWRCSRSILSSKLERTEAMARCSGRGGRRNKCCFTTSVCTRCLPELPVIDRIATSRKSGDIER